MATQLIRELTPRVMSLLTLLAVVVAILVGRAERDSLAAQIATKADTSLLREIRAGQTSLQIKIDSLAKRQHEFFCYQRETFCR